MYTYTWYQWLEFFYLYCFFGWVFESTYVSIKEGTFVNRGFLRLPMLPLYGSGAIMMLWVSTPFQGSLVLTWCSGVIGATLLEYITGYIMELLFKIRYWDYSDQKYNLHGYICLSSSIAWGFLTIFMTHLIHKPIERGVLSMPLPWNLLFISVVSVLFTYDSIVCTREAFAFGKSLEAIKKLRQELDILQVQTALLKMEAEERLQEARSEFMEQAAAFTEMRMGTLDGLKSRAGDRFDSLKELTAMSLEEIRTKAEGKLDGLKDTAGISLSSLRGKSEQQLAELLKEKEAAMASLRSRSLPFGRHLFHANPSASSHKYTREFKDIMEYLDRSKKGSRS